MSAQSDFRTLDMRTYDYYLKGDYKNLKKAADTMISNGIDYYYLRMRLGILAYNKQLYPNAVENLIRAAKFNSLDTISREYIYKSFLYSGRKSDADFFLESIPIDKKNNTLKSIGKPGFSELYIGSSINGYDVILYETYPYTYEAVRINFSINAGFETYFSGRLKGTFALTNFNKSGTAYSSVNSSGEPLNFTQNQVYGKLSGYLFPGWELSGFVHAALYSEDITLGSPNNRITRKQTINEYLAGIGITKNGWKIRSGANISFSNFSNSNQIRGEGYISWLPSGNLNLYFTTCYMGQTDKKWGVTYQVNQEAGIKISKSIWIESGIVKGNSFLYARNQGFMMNNSFQIPATTIYSNILILPWNHFSLSISPFYNKNNFYTWDTNAYTRTNKLILNSFGGSIKLTYKN